jgi:transcription elongation factor SPT6
VLQVPKEKLLIALERAIVETTNDVGVDINRAVMDAYYRLLLPFVCGLGPRKAQQLIKNVVNIVRFCMGAPDIIH